MNSSFRKSEGRKNYRLVKFLLIAAPVVIYVKVPAMPELFMYLMVSFVLIGWLSHKWLQSSLIAVGLFLTGIVYAWYNPYLWNRLMAAINPLNDPSGAGYLYVQTAAVIHSSGWGRICNQWK